MCLFWKQSQQISKDCVKVLTSADKNMGRIFTIRNCRFAGTTLKQALLLRTETGRKIFASKSQNLECLWKQSYLCLSWKTETFPVNF